MGRITWQSGSLNRSKTIFVFLISFDLKFRWQPRDKWTWRIHTSEIDVWALNEIRLDNTLENANFTIDGYDLITKYRNFQGSLFQALR